MSGMNRRGFLKRGMAVTAGSYVALSSFNRWVPSVRGANDEVRLGIAGIHSRVRPVRRLDAERSAQRRRRSATTAPAAMSRPRMAPPSVVSVGTAGTASTVRVKVVMLSLRALPKGDGAKGHVAKGDVAKEDADTLAHTCPKCPSEQSLS